MKKTLMIMLALVLVIAMSVTGTLAYLTSNDSVTNTFTVGKVEITLDEAKVTEYGVKDGDTRVDANTYKLIPGHNYLKDPVVHFQPDSEASYLFIKVENGIANIEADTKIAAQIVANGWTAYSVAGVYYKEVDANTSDKAVDYPVFGEFTIADEADVSEYAGATIIVTAYAVQHDGLTVDEAWAAANP